MATIYRFNEVPITISKNNIKNIYVENSILYINLLNGDRVCGYNVKFD